MAAHEIETFAIPRGAVDRASARGGAVGFRDFVSRRDRGLRHGRRRTARRRDPRRPRAGGARTAARVPRGRRPVPAAQSTTRPPRPTRRAPPSSAACSASPWRSSGHRADALVESATQRALPRARTRLPDGARRGDHRWHFERNLARLARRNPRLADRVAKADAGAVVIERGPTGAATLVEAGVRLASAYDPVAEGRRLAETALADAPDLLVAVGLGLGHQLEAFRAARAAPILVYEPSLARWRALLEARERARLAGRRRRRLRRRSRRSRCALPGALHRRAQRAHLRPAGRRAARSAARARGARSRGAGQTRSRQHRRRRASR